MAFCNITTHLSEQLGFLFSPCFGAVRPAAFSSCLHMCIVDKPLAFYSVLFFEGRLTGDHCTSLVGPVLLSPL